MASPKTQPTDKSVTQFLERVENKQKRADAFAIMEMMREATGEEPVMWGDSIVGYGCYHYVYASGREGDSPLVAFSPRKQSLTLYVMSDMEEQDALLARLGKHTTSKACLYIKRLSDVDQGVLRELVAKCAQHVRETGAAC